MRANRYLTAGVLVGDGSIRQPNRIGFIPMPKSSITDWELVAKPRTAGWS
jgi:hypothetical protein